MTLKQAGHIDTGDDGREGRRAIVAADGLEAVGADETMVVGLLLDACNTLMVVCAGDDGREGADARSVLALVVDFEGELGVPAGAPGDEDEDEDEDDGDDGDFLGGDAQTSEDNGTEGETVVEGEGEAVAEGGGTAAEGVDSDITGPAGDGDDDEDDLVADLEGFLGDREGGGD